MSIKKSATPLGNNDYNSPASWTIAKESAELFAPVPGIISYCVTKLITERDNTQDNFNSFLKPIDKIATIKNALYFGAASLFPDRILGNNDSSSRDLVNILSPSLYASLLAATYIFRRSQKLFKLYRCPLSNADDFLTYSELGYIVGDSIPSLGSADGVILGSLLQAALSTFMIREPERYKNYRKAKNYFLDQAFEHKSFGCDRAQVAAYLVRMFGYSQESPYDIREAFLGNEDAVIDRSELLSAWAAGIPIIEQCANNKITEINFTEIDLGKVTPKMVQDMAQKVLTVGPSFKWMKEGFTLTEITEKVEELISRTEVPAAVATGV